MRPLGALPTTIALCLLLVACPLPAQQAEPEPAAPVAQPAPAERDADSEDDGQRSADRPPPSDDSPFDYQASEEISEDLSVSFPVDI